MEKIIYNLVFNRKKQLTIEGKALIQVEAYLNKKKRYFSTKVYVKSNQWDVNRHLIKNHPNKDGLNKFLQAFIANLEREELSATLNGKSLTLQNLLATPEPEAVPPTSFSRFLKEEIENSNLRPSTRKNHLSTFHILSQYKADVSFDELNFTLLFDFEAYLLNLKYHCNTIAKHMKHLKRYVNLAINKDMMDIQKYPFRKYKIKYVESKRAHLTPDELGRMEALKPKEGKSIKRSLDMFLFSCYTGLRFSDVVSIKQDNFHEIDNQVWLIYSSVKTDVDVRLPLSLLFEGKAIPIYRRYQNNGHSLFGVSIDANSNVNKQIHRLSKMAEIDKNVSFHTARHTNATLLLYKGANITTVQKLLGHKSVRTTEIYSNIMDMTIVRDLEKIGGRL
ncbi:MAG: site-specific integrase [Tannerellaceae bacterium]